MATFAVTVSAEIPYPWPRVYRVDRSSPAAAASEAIKRYPKDVRKKLGRSKRLRTLTVQITKETACAEA